MEPTWTDVVSAWASVATAVLTLALVVLAGIAWRTAIATLEASKAASDAAARSANAASAANDQALRDSIEQTRPYVYAEVVPGLHGIGCWDVRITNSGRSAAREVTFEYDSWPEDLDDVAESVHELFVTPRTLPPGSSIRAIWRLDAGHGDFGDGTSIAGLGTGGELSARYTSDDPSRPEYRDKFDVMIERSGLWPVPGSGPEPPNGLDQEKLAFYKLARILIEKVGELKR